MIKRVFFSILTIGLLTACNTTQLITTPYTSVDKVMKVKAGMSFEQVSSTLGIQPYDIYVIEEDGGTILIYNYLRRNRKLELPMEKLNETKHKEEGLSSGEEWYDVKNPSKIYVYFVDGKMVSLISDRGRADAAALMVTQNSISLISQEDLVSNPGGVATPNIEPEDTRLIPIGGNRNQSENPQVEEQEKKSSATRAILGVLGAVLILGLGGALLAGA